MGPNSERWALALSLPQSPAVDKGRLTSGMIRKFAAASLPIEIDSYGGKYTEVHFESAHPTLVQYEEISYLF